MKRFKLLAIGLLLSAAPAAMSQNTVSLSIEHYLQDNAFALYDTARTYDNHKFDVARLEYYISEISIVDNNNNTYDIDSLWVLVNASHPTEIDLDTHAIDSVSKVVFHIGVDQDHNHLDPSGWPNEHPLAHKNPSMHWGWANGYRFAAMEGDAGENLGYGYELHGLGDENYFSVEVEVNAGVDNGHIDVVVYANYAEMLRGIDISNGVISHGPIYEAKTSLENMRDYVFGPTIPESTVQVPIDTTDSSVSINKIAMTDVFGLYPNPCQSELINLQRPKASNELVQVQIFDVQGQLVRSLQVQPGQTQLDLDGLSPGVYTLMFGGINQNDIERSSLRLLKL